MDGKLPDFGKACLLPLRLGRFDFVFDRWLRNTNRGSNAEELEANRYSRHREQNQTCQQEVSQSWFCERRIQIILPS